MKKLLISALLLMATLGVMAQDASNKLLAPGTLAPFIGLHLESDNSFFNIRNTKGKYVVIDFWASWSKDSRADMPRVVNERNHWSSDDVFFIGVSYDTQQELWKNYIHQNKLNFPQVSELVRFKATKSAIAYHVDSLPTYYLLDKENKVMIATTKFDEISAKLKQLHESGQIKKKVNNPLSRPEFPGGNDELSMYIFKNMKYTPNILTYGVSGRVTVSFVVGDDGTLKDIKAKNVDRVTVAPWATEKFSSEDMEKGKAAAMEDMKKEAVRVVTSMPKWTPGKHDGKNVEVNYSLPVTFRVRQTH